VLGSSIVDVALGIAFVFFLLSLIASTLNELILSFSNMRGRFLLEGLKTLLDDANATGLVKDVYNHGLIYGLFKGEFDPENKGDLPSYIPSGNFVSALLDVVGSTGSADKKPDMNGLQQAAERLAKDPQTEKVGKPLLSMIHSSGNDLSALKAGVEDWYNSAMARVSGWYKYRTQWCLFGIGLVLAISLNADTIHIVRQLSVDSTLRQSIVAAVQSAKAPENKPGQSVQDQIQQAHQQVSRLGNLGIPLGWAGAWRPGEPAGSESWLWAWLSICGGWLVTAVAISLGAPFWFDVLNKIAVIRSTLKPAEKGLQKGSEEKSKR